MAAPASALAGGWHQTHGVKIRQWKSRLGVKAAGFRKTGLIQSGRQIEAGNRVAAGGAGGRSGSRGGARGGFGGGT